MFVKKKMVLSWAHIRDETCNSDWLSLDCPRTLELMEMI